MWTVATYSAIVIIYFLQLFGAACSFPLQQPTEDLGKGLFLVTKYMRIVPILSTISYEYITVVALGFFLFLDVLFLVFIQ